MQSTKHKHFLGIKIAVIFKNPKNKKIKNIPFHWKVLLTIDLKRKSHNHHSSLSQQLSLLFGPLFFSNVSNLLNFFPTFWLCLSVLKDEFCLFASRHCFGIIYQIWSFPLWFNACWFVLQENKPNVIGRYFLKCFQWSFNRMMIAFFHFLLFWEYSHYFGFFFFS